MATLLKSLKKLIQGRFFKEIKRKTDMVMVLEIEIKVDGETLILNKFAEKILSSTIAGAISPLQAEKGSEKKEKIGENWQKIEIELNK